MSGLFGYIIPATALFLVIYWILPFKWRQHAVSLFSTAVLFSTGLGFGIYVLCVAYLLSWHSFQNNQRQKNALIGFALAIITIAFWKYIIGFFTSLSFFDEKFRLIFATIGVSYMGLRLTDLYLSILRRQVKEASFATIIHYLTFFPLLPAGPLMRYKQFESAADEHMDWTVFGQSLLRILTGVFKKFFILGIVVTGYFGELTSAVVEPDGVLTHFTRLDILVAGGVLFLTAYIDISAYTDIAIGVSRLFGFTVHEDLNYPLIKKNVTLFWRSWHITVVSWCRDNIYIPIYFKTQNLYLATLATFLVMGIWHNVDYQWVAWGLYQGIGISLFLYLGRHQAFNKLIALCNKYSFGVFSYALTLFWASFAFLIMGPESISQSMQVISKLF